MPFRITVDIYAMWYYRNLDTQTDNENIMYTVLEKFKNQHGAFQREVVSIQSSCLLKSIPFLPD